uniref:Resistance gene n=1 Tax=Solanum tuberosum TaxID=4113 RepID=M1BF55_SOLTU
MPNLEYLDLRECRSLEEVQNSLGCSRKLIGLDLSYCESLERFPYVNAESLKSLNLKYCSSLEKFPEFLGIMKPELYITMSYSGIRELPLSIIHPRAHLRDLHLPGLKNLVSLPSSICKLKGLVRIDVSFCVKLERLPEEIGDLENLERLDAHFTLISRPPSSIIRLNKLKFLTFAKRVDGVYFFFPQVDEGLRSLKSLDLSYCNIIDGGLPEDIGSLSSLKELKLGGNNFEHLPRSIAQLGALQTLDLSHCMRLTQLPEFPQQLHTIAADWSNDSICNSLFQNISSLQHDLCTSDSLSLGVFTTEGDNIPRWFHHREDGTSIYVKLPKNWYVSENFLGFAVCFSCKYNDGIAHLFCYHGRPVTCIAQKLALSIH